VTLLDRVREALPSENLQRIFRDLIEALQDTFVLEEAHEKCESGLLVIENELRQYTKKEVSGLLSTKVINLRKEVEK
jgi:hypothetical protein